jgi:hypothetical protein
MSVAYNEWSTARSAALNEIAEAHRSVGGTGRGRRYATQQINQAYAVLLSSQFQGYCRDLHSECVEHLVRSVTPVAFRTALRKLLTQDRKLDRGNPSPGNIGSDFWKLDIDLWSASYALDSRNRNRRALLEELNNWRNAIAHQDFAAATLAGRTTLTLQHVRRWRSACDALAGTFDRAMYDHIKTLTGTAPW